MWGGNVPRPIVERISPRLKAIANSISTYIHDWVYGYKEKEKIWQNRQTFIQ